MEVLKDRVIYNFTEYDTVVFSYSGNDTLIYEVSDSNLTDTIMFIGKGKNFFFTEGNHRISLEPECNGVPVDLKNMEIKYSAIPASFPELTFTLTGGFGGAGFRYVFDNYLMNGIAGFVSLAGGTNYFSVFEYKGRRFYKVNRITNNDSGYFVEYYLNKEDQLILFRVDSTTTYFKIN